MNIKCANCTQEVTVGEEFAGKAIMCPHCGVVIPIPRAATGEARPKLQVTGKAAESQKTCPSCHTWMADSAVLCVNCGYDFRSGAVAAGAARTPRRSAAPVALIALAVVVALGAAAWYVWPALRSAGPHKAPPPPPPPALAAQTVTVVTNAMALRQITIAPWRRVPAGFEGSTLDFVLYATQRLKLPIAIDPYVVADAARNRVTLAPEEALTNITVVASLLKPLGYTIKQAALTPGVKVMFVTTASAWSYGTALWTVGQGDLAAAIEMLKKTPPESSEFGAQCRELRVTLETIQARDKVLRDTGQELQHNLELYAANQKRITATQASAEVAMSEKSRDLTTSESQAAEQRANDYARRCRTAVIAADKQITESNRALAARYNECRLRQNFGAEARLLAQHLVTAYESMQNMVKLVADARLRRLPDETPLPAIGPVPDTIRDALASLNAESEYVQRGVNEALSYLDQNPSKAYQSFTLAYNIDRCSLMSRIGIGYCQALAQQAALAELAANRPDAGGLPRVQTRLARGNFPRLAAALAFIQTPGEKRVVNRPARVGYLDGLFFSTVDARSTVCPVFVKFVEHTAPPRFNNDANQATPYWNAVVLEEVKARLPPDVRVIFGNYGKRDVPMELSAIPAWRWLESVDSEKVLPSGKDMRIEFQEQLSPRGGDAASVVFALGGYSALKNAPLYNDTALVGSIRPDGSVISVPAIDLKIGGALAGDSGVETIIVPRENEPDLAALTWDQLCRVTLIAVPDAQTYLRYLQVPEQANVDLRRVYSLKEEHAAEGGAPAGARTFTLWQDISELPSGKQLEHYAVDVLEEAQVYLLAGDREQAIELLQIVDKLNPEIYNARRLLELLRLYAPPATREPAAAPASS